MKLIIGLGNPDQKYHKTRHNAGFLAVEHLAKNYGHGQWSTDKKHNAQVHGATIMGQKVLLVKPLTYMNLSGQTVQSVMQYYKISPENILVLYDDLDVPFGAVKFREKGSSAGHNGLKSIQQHIGTQEYARVKIGIHGDTKTHIQGADYVLGKWTKPEQERLPEILQVAEQKVLQWII